MFKSIFSNPGESVGGIPDIGMALLSTDTIVISSDADSPSYLTGFTSEYLKGISLTDVATGTVRNDSGKTLNMMGTINYHPNASGAVATLNIISERSADGITWEGNLSSRRTIEISNTGESFGTKASILLNWEPGHFLRFRFWVSTGNLQLESSTAAALGGQVFTCPALAWMLHEI